MHKVLFIVLDGLGDLPIKELSNKTPLETAVTPNLDRLAQSANSGIVFPVAKGIAPESDIAVISLLGYDAQKYYTGRGPIEAFAQNMDFKAGDVALRANFASVGNGTKSILDRRAGRDLSEEEAAQLAKEINAKVVLSSATFEFVSTVSHRAILVLKGMRLKLSGKITNTDPAYERKGTFGVAKEQFIEEIQDALPMPEYSDLPAARETALIINEFSSFAHKVLQESAINQKRISGGKLPANALLLRDAGDCLPQFPYLESIYNRKFACFVEMPVERGIAKLTGMTVIDVPKKSGHPDVDYPVWAKIAQDALKNCDCLYVHIKGPDEPSHDGDAKAKIRVIEAIDKFFFAKLMRDPDLKNTSLAVTADHSTSCEKKAHTDDPVPLLVCGPSIKPDGTMSFSEKTAKLGSLGELSGREVLPLLMKISSQ